jgi:hypothetical protein
VSAERSGQQRGAVDLAQGRRKRGRWPRSGCGTCSGAHRGMSAWRCLEAWEAAQIDAVWLLRIEQESEFRLRAPADAAAPQAVIAHARLGRVRNAPVVLLSGSAAAPGKSEQVEKAHWLRLGRCDRTGWRRDPKPALRHSPPAQRFTGQCAFTVLQRLASRARPVEFPDPFATLPQALGPLVSHCRAGCSGRWLLKDRIQCLKEFS